MSEFAAIHERLGRMHGYADVTGPEFDPGVPVPPETALVTMLHTLVETVERMNARLIRLEMALKAGAIGDWR